MLEDTNLRVPVALAGILLLLTACAGPKTVSGECQTVFGGDVCTWGTLENGSVLEFGATVPLTTVMNAPADGPMVFPPVPDAVIPLPSAVARDTGFNHLAINWEMHGHPPALFFTPHFDFHFYKVGPEAAAAIDCSDTRKPQQIPANYALPDVEIPGMGTLIGLCVPQMGMHAMPAAELAVTDPFSASMLVGYYQQEFTFLEPMISKAKLMEAKSFSMTVPRLPGITESLRWPSRSDIIYDPEARVYRFVFSGLSAN